jgi:transposase
LYNVFKLYRRGSWTLKTKEGWEMYIEIKRLKSKGFSNSKIAKMLGISRPTVIKYVNMDDDEFEKTMEGYKYRTKKPDIYRKEIHTWLKQYPGMTSAQVYDWLEEKYRKINFNESTMRSYVRMIREEYNIPKEPTMRQYEAVDDPPMGKQMQVDFGEKKVKDLNEKIITLYVMCFVLSNSRYKYCEWQNRPFNTADIIRIHENAFEYYGGFPEEIVYDQDHLILVSENHGELIYTKEFAAYLQKRRFRVHMCRSADPESKGRIEKVVDFVKNNFASYRTFYNIDRWNEDCIKWLARRGNGKLHKITRKIPAEVFIEERKYLQPVTDKVISKSHSVSITYQVRKDNTVPVKGNRYTVPRGTYKGPYTYVLVNKIGDNHLVISDLESGKELARHEIPPTKGNLQTNNDHRRDKYGKISKIIENVSEKFTSNSKAKYFLDTIHREKPRYIRDQLILIQSVMKKNTTDVLDKALDYCVKNMLFSAVDFRDAAKHFSREYNTPEKNILPPVLIELSLDKINAKAQVRDMSEYIKIMSNSKGG